MNLSKKAFKFAEVCHDSQVRKYTGEPYFGHCLEVAQLIRENAPFHSEEMIAAAYLHDVVEDTPITIDVIQQIFGPTVGMYVWFLTDTARPEDGNRKARKAIDRNRMALAPSPVKTIKLADLISNTQSIAKYDPGFANVYMEEKREMLRLNVLGAGNVELLNKARKLIDDWDESRGRRFDWHSFTFIETSE